MKGLYQRGNTWWLRFTPAPGAAQYRQSLETEDEAKAITKARGIIATATKEMRAEMESCARERDLYLAACLKDRKRRNTVKVRKSALNGLIKSARVATPRHITPSMVDAWLEPHREKNLQTARVYLSAARHWFQHLMEARKITRAPTEKMDLPEPQVTGRKTFLRPPQARALIDATKDLPALRFAVYCALHAGMRRLEVVEARPNWFDLDAGLIHIQATDTFTPKDNENRTVPMTEEFRTWLRDEYGLPSPFMMAPERTHGKSPYRYNFNRVYETTIKTLALDWRVTFHDLRRTFSSLHVSQGTSIFKVAEWLGDDVKIVQSTYAHLIPQDETINTIWSTPKTPAPTRNRFTIYRELTQLSIAAGRDQEEHEIWLEELATSLSLKRIDDLSATLPDLEKFLAAAKATQPPA